MDAEKILPAYIRAINTLNDYFEYRFKSKQDQTAVYEILYSLTEDLHAISRKSKGTGLTD